MLRLGAEVLLHHRRVLRCRYEDSRVSVHLRELRCAGQGSGAAGAGTRSGTGGASPAPACNEPVCISSRPMCIVPCARTPGPRLTVARRRDRRHHDHRPLTRTRRLDGGRRPRPCSRPARADAARLLARDRRAVVALLRLARARRRGRRCCIVYVPRPDPGGACCNASDAVLRASSSRPSIIKIVAGGKRRADLTAQRGHATRRDGAARAHGAGGADGGAAGADRAALPVQHARAASTS